MSFSSFVDNSALNVSGICFSWGDDVKGETIIVFCGFNMADVFTAAGIWMGREGTKFSKSVYSHSDLVRFGSVLKNRGKKAEFQEFLKDKNPPIPEETLMCTLSIKCSPLPEQAVVIQIPTIELNRISLN